MILHFHFHHSNNLFIKNLILLIFLFFVYLSYIEAMRVHPMETGRNIIIRNFSDFNPLQMERNPLKKLRKLPHVFSKVLELPFKSDADVDVEEGPDFIRFVAGIEVNDGATVRSTDVRAHAVEIHPGVIKIVVRHGGDVELSLDNLEIDTWRYRLPPAALPELATAVFVDGELIVMVPKSDGVRKYVGREEVWEGGNRLLLVQ